LLVRVLPVTQIPGLNTSADDGMSEFRPAVDSWERRRAQGKALRKKVPRESHATYARSRNRPDPLDLLAASNVGRQAKFIPVRMGRMAASPFAFLRGSSVVWPEILPKAQ